MSSDARPATSRARRPRSGRVRWQAARRLGTAVRRRSACRPAAQPVQSVAQGIRATPAGNGGLRCPAAGRPRRLAAPGASAASAASRSAIAFQRVRAAPCRASRHAVEDVHALARPRPPRRGSDASTSRSRSARSRSLVVHQAEHVVRRPCRSRSARSSLHRHPPLPVRRLGHRHVRTRSAVPAPRKRSVSASTCLRSRSMTFHCSAICVGQFLDRPFLFCSPHFQRRQAVAASFDHGLTSSGCAAKRDCDSGSQYHRRAPSGN